MKVKAGEASGEIDVGVLKVSGGGEDAGGGEIWLEELGLHVVEVVGVEGCGDVLTAGGCSVALMAVLVVKYELPKNVFCCWWWRRWLVVVVEGVSGAGCVV